MLDKKELKEKELKHVSGGADDDYTMESIRAVIVNLINEKNKAFSPALTVGSSLNDLSADSLDVVDVVRSVGERYNIDLEAKLPSINNFDDLVLAVYDSLS